MNVKLNILSLTFAFFLVFLLSLVPPETNLPGPGNSGNVASYFLPVIFMALPFAFAAGLIIKFSSIENNQENWEKIFIRTAIYTAILLFIYVKFIE